MVIISQPAALNLSGNLADILISSQDVCEFALYQDNKLILQEKYYPDENAEILIELKDEIDNLLSVTVPGLTTGNLFQEKSISNFRAEINVLDDSDIEEVSFKVIKGGIDLGNLAIEDFLKKNFLTWQPQQKQVKLDDPEWLSYYATAFSNVKIKGYFPGIDPVTSDLLSIAQATLCSFSVKYSTLVTKFPDIPKYIDVWIEQFGEKVSFTQRYVLSSRVDEFDDLFVFENTLGGVDTIRFNGQIEENQEYKFENALFKKQNRDYYVEPNPVFTKNSGIFSSERERQWSLEFFSSLQKFHINSGKLKQVRVIKHTLESVRGNIADYDFDFTWTEQTKYLNLTRLEDLPELEIPEEDPGNGDGGAGSDGGIVKIIDQNSNIVQLVTAPGEFKVMAFTGIKVDKDAPDNISIIVQP